MTKEVALADLQEHLAEHIDEVKTGTSIRVVEGGTTVAEIHPPKEEEWVWENGLRVRPPKGNMRDVKLPSSMKVDRDPVEYLLEDRYGRTVVDDIVDEYLDRLRKQQKQ